MKNKEKLIWSVDCMIDIFDCDPNVFNELKIKEFARAISKIIEPSEEIVGMVNPFGDHESRMKGFRLVHENMNSLITANFVEQGHKVFLNLSSCAPYKVSEVLSCIKEFLKTEDYFCRRALREYDMGSGESE